MQPTKATQSITASPTLPPFARRTATLCAVLLSGSVSAAGGSCSNATDLADDACGATVRADLFLARAVCADVPGANAREACRTTANRVAADSREQCTAQEQARKRLCKKLGDGPYNPPFRASNFVTAAAAAAQPNTYFPLIPGMRQVYRGEGETNVIEVLNEYKLINGVQCRTVHDTVSRNIEGHDVVLEDTQDWFAQDLAGNVWYCGEISQRFEYVSDDHAAELVGIGGSWKALREHAKPGVVMFAHPEVGRVYRQEFDLGNAEDFARIVSKTASYTATVGSCNGTCVVTRDYTPLDPGHVEIKVYSPGFGLIKEIDPETREVTLELVEMSTPVVPM